MTPDEAQPELALASTTPSALPAPARVGNPSLAHVDGMFKNWFTEYASYVILDRAVPHIDDGLKPVQRRILHSLRELEDGRYNKVANTVGNTMKYHPHGDASITDALVGLGQKDLLIDTQGNWGNIITGDPAAAPRYIEARLSKFALEAVFNPKITQWTRSYDERNQEPITLPIRFPLLLAQGVEGIAVGLSCKILPHNFVELIDGSIAVLRGKTPTLYPDFLTGGLMDASDYNDGQRGGTVRVRARIDIRSPQLLAITEIPYGTVVPNLINSILAAHQKGKIKIKKVDDNTSEKAEILIHLLPGSDPEVTKKALYAFTDCEVLIHPNAVVILDQKPSFTSIGEILRVSTERTRDLLGRELEIYLNELNARWHQLSLEKIFIEKKIYQKIEKCETWESILTTIAKGLEPYTKGLRDPVTQDDCARLTEIRIKRISRFDSRSADEELKKIKASIAETKSSLANLTAYTIDWFKALKKKFAKGRERRTELAAFKTIAAASVALANVKPFVNREEGFIGWGLRRDPAAEPLGDCSDLDEIVAIRADGQLKINKVAEKEFYGTNLLHAAIFTRGDTSTTYNLLYEHEKGGVFAKRFHLGEGIVRDRLYPVAPGKVLFFSVTKKPQDAPYVSLRPRARKGEPKADDLEFDFATLEVKSRNNKGTLVTKLKVQKAARSKRSS